MDDFGQDARSVAHHKVWMVCRSDWFRIAIADLRHDLPQPSTNEIIIARFAAHQSTNPFDMSTGAGEHFEDAAAWLSSTPAAANLSNDVKLEVSTAN